MHDRQLSLFNSTSSRIAGLDRGIKVAMNEACRNACIQQGLSRDNILDKMNEIALKAGVRLTGGNAHALSLAMFEKWLNPADKGHMPSLRALAVFCAAVESVTPFAVLVASVGGAVINETQQIRLEQAEIDDEIKRLQRRKKHLKARG